MSAGQAAEAMGRAGILQPGAEYAECGPGCDGEI